MRTFVYAALLSVTLFGALWPLSSDPRLIGLLQMAQASALLETRDVYTESAEELKYSGAMGLVSVLDDYSTWHDRRTDTLLRQEASGHYGGFGIEIVNYRDTTIIWQVFPGSPARTAGLKMGDRLLSADTVSLVGPSLDSVHQVLQTIPKQEVDLTVLRPGSTGLVRIRCARGRIEIGTVRVWDLHDSVGYITLESFNGETSQALERALDTLTRAGAGRFILDLRGNPGGLLDAAVECAELFMATTGTVVKVTDAGPTETIEAEPGPFATQSLVILVDENSASGSELFAGCLQDWDRAVLIGRPTFGKGFIQNLFPLLDESSVRLTIGRYRTPSGRTFYRPDSTSSPDTARYASLVHHRPLVGGGQIFPDLQVADLDCPTHLLGWANSRGLFEYAVELLSYPALPPLDAHVLDAFWNSPHDDYRGGLAGEMEGLLPERWPDDPEWRRIADSTRRAEREFDRNAGRDCLLYVLARHLARGEARVNFLAEPLLSLDPALAEAMSVLLTPGRYEQLLQGEGSPAPATEAALP